MWELRTVFQGFELCFRVRIINVKSLLASDDFLKSFQISVETYKGIVQLSGFVNSQQAVDKAGQIARSVKGVTSVKNSLIVK